MSGSGKGMKKGLTSYGDSGFSLFLRKAFIKGAGYTDDALDRPIVGIANTASAYNPCHGNAAQLVEAVKRGVMLAGGLPMDFPSISIHESFASPTSMYLRNLMSMDTEEMIRAQHDGVRLGGAGDDGTRRRFAAGGHRRSHSRRGAHGRDRRGDGRVEAHARQDHDREGVPAPGRACRCARAPRSS